MISLALRIIAFRPARYLVALLGIAVAAGLAFIQLGLYLGFKENASVIPDHTRGDLWVCAQFQDNFDFPSLLNDRHLERIKSVRGVASVSCLLIVFGDWKLPDGREISTQIIGFDPRLGAGQPWAMSAGLPGDLQVLGAVTVDETTRAKLGRPELGCTAEIEGKQVRVAGLTRGIRSFQGHPLVFASLETARALRRLRTDEFHYAVVQAAPREDLGAVRERLRALPHVEAYTAAEFSAKAQHYWLTSTGAGTALFMAALLGLVVGVVVAGQVLYTSTIENIKEYGTLKAIGASNRQVTVAILAQALAWAFPAHLLAGILLWIAGRCIGGKGIHLSLDWTTYWLLGGVTILVCAAASLLSVVRVLRVEPADVFKG